jgi:hypothetical protein
MRSGLSRIVVALVFGFAQVYGDTLDGDEGGGTE